MLADAEALCSRVAILANGRLVTAGRLSDILAFQARGWELVVNDLTEERAQERAGSRSCPGRDAARRIAIRTGTAAGAAARANPGQPADGGAHLVSLNPLRDTLEDVFVRQVSAAPQARGMESL